MTEWIQRGRAYAPPECQVYSGDALCPIAASPGATDVQIQDFVDDNW